MRQASEVPVKYATREKNPTNDDNMVYYSETYPAEYVITFDGERILSLPSVPVNAAVIQVELETKPLKGNQWRWNPITRVLTFKGGPTLDPWDPGADNVDTYANQLVSVLYKIYKTTM